jgi:KDO2-lipid IV(A) lauroyltransferase
MTLTHVRHGLEYGMVLAMRALVSVLPDALTRGLGSCLGFAFYVLDPAHRRLAVAQLRAAFPLKSDAECRAIARATFAHFGRLLTVVLRFSTMTPDDIRRRIEVEGEQRVHEALADGRGVLMFTGHFGYWELQGLAHPLVLPPLAVLARPIDNPYLHAFMERTRQAHGNRVVYRQGALRKVLRVLDANGCVAILIDQHIQRPDSPRRGGRPWNRRSTGGTGPPPRRGRRRRRATRGAPGR